MSRGLVNLVCFVSVLSVRLEASVLFVLTPEHGRSREIFSHFTGETSSVGIWRADNVYEVGGQGEEISEIIYLGYEDLFRRRPESLSLPDLTKFRFQANVAVEEIHFVSQWDDLKWRSSTYIRENMVKREQIWRNALPKDLSLKFAASSLRYSDEFMAVQRIRSTRARLSLIIGSVITFILQPAALAIASRLIVIPPEYGEIAKGTVAAIFTTSILATFRFSEFVFDGKLWSKLPDGFGERFTEKGTYLNSYSRAVLKDGKVYEGHYDSGQLQEKMLRLPNCTSSVLTAFFKRFYPPKAY